MIGDEDDRRFWAEAARKLEADIPHVISGQQCIAGASVGVGGNTSGGGEAEKAKEDKKAEEGGEEGGDGAAEGAVVGIGSGGVLVRGADGALVLKKGHKEEWVAALAKAGKKAAK